MELIKLLKQLPENDIAEADELMVFIDEKRHRPNLYLSTKIRNKLQVESKQNG
jgi:hypothetical protein